MNRNEPIIVEQSFDKPIDVIWKAITELGQMVQWFFENIPDFKPEVGFKTQFSVKPGERNFLHLWEIIEVEQGKKIVYSWRYQEYPGNGKVIFELTEKGNQTVLRLTNEGLDSFPEEIPEFSLENCIGGWNYFIKERLKTYIDTLN